MNILKRIRRRLFLPLRPYAKRTDQVRHRLLATLMKEPGRWYQRDDLLGEKLFYTRMAFYQLMEAELIHLRIDIKPSNERPVKRISDKQACTDLLGAWGTGTVRMKEIGFAVTPTSESCEVWMCLTPNGEDRYFNDMAEDRRSFVDIWGGWVILFLFCGFIFEGIQAWYATHPVQFPDPKTIIAPVRKPTLFNLDPMTEVQGYWALVAYDDTSRCPCRLFP